MQNFFFKTQGRRTRELIILLLWVFRWKTVWKKLKLAVTEEFTVLAIQAMPNWVEELVEYLQKGPLPFVVIAFHTYSSLIT